MNLAEIVKKTSKELNISGAELAKRSNQSPQNLSKKLVKGTLSFDEFEKLMEVMGVELELELIMPNQESVKESSLDKRYSEQLTILEKQLEVERLKSKYFTDMSYDFRTALSTLDAGIRLAISHCDDSDKVKEYLSRVMPAIQTLNRLVEDNPFNREAGISSIRNDAETEEDSLRNKHVLLVDDNDLNREIVKELLEDNDIKIDEAANGAEAVDMIKSAKERYDFVLMDIIMPVMDGFEATRRVRKFKDKDMAGIPVIAMTASVTYEDREEARESGMNGFIEKPLDIKKLKNVINKLN